MSNKPLCVIDTSVVTHLLMDLTHGKDGKLKNPISNQERDDRIKIGQQAYSSLFWLIGEDISNWDILWVGDSKECPLWRTVEVREWLDSLPSDAPQLTKRKGSRSGYKGNRQTSPSAQWAGKRAIKFADPVLFPGYEADDVMAGVVKSFPEREILLATVDSDWLQCVKDKDEHSEKVSWVCLKGFSPQYRDTKRGLEWFENKISKESVKTKDTIDTSSLRNIVDWKMLVGDVSDNLPADTPRQFIDLFEPGEFHKLWLNDSFKSIISDKIIPATTDDDAFMEWTNKYGEFKTKTCLIK